MVPLGKAEEAVAAVADGGMTPSEARLELSLEAEGDLMPYGEVAEIREDCLGIAERMVEAAARGSGGEGGAVIIRLTAEPADGSTYGFVEAETPAGESIDGEWRRDEETGDWLVEVRP